MIERAMEMALREATLSPDKSTQIGAVIIRNSRILGSGHNTYPFGVEVTNERLERPLKYSFIEHAERNAIYSAVRLGETTLGATMVCNFAACADCAKGIIQSGIKTLVRYPNDLETNWNESIAIGDQMMKESGVDIVEPSFNIQVPPILKDGKLWTP